MKPSQLQIVGITDDATIRHVVDSLCTGDEWRVEWVDGVAELFTHLSHTTTMLLIDEATSGTTGYVSVARRARKDAPTVDVTVVGGPKSEEVRAGERVEGVDLYVGRPVEEAVLRAVVRRRMQLVELKSSVGIVGRSEGLEELLEAVLQVAPTEVPILIEGESGTGKDLVARAIHEASRRSSESFEAINCGSLAEGVLESELFGHEKGAFTGAVGRRAGMFERADRGTIFLDEVGEMSPNMQVRLLRVLESGEVLRVGGVNSFRVDVRVVAATNRNLGEVVRSGAFRQDLYYRLRGINLFLPPLRERVGDISILTQHFIAASNRRHHKSVRGVEPTALRRMEEHGWPGNIRELRNFVDTLVVLSTGAKITASLVNSRMDDHTVGDRRGVDGPPPLLPVALHRSKDEAEREMIYASILALHRDVREILGLLQGPQASKAWRDLKEVRAEVPPDEPPPLNLVRLERTAIQQALARFGGNRRRAAQSLGISERTLYRKIKEYGLV